MDCWLWVLIWDVMHTWQASIYFYFFTCIFSDEEWNHTHKERKRERCHIFLIVFFMNFLFFQSLAFLDIQDMPGLPLLSSMLSLLCLTVLTPVVPLLTTWLLPWSRLSFFYLILFSYSCTGNTSILLGSELLHCCWQPFLSWEKVYALSSEDVLDSYSKNGMSCIVFWFYYKRAEPKGLWLHRGTRSL